jgi:Domain of unknown function (DUF4383)
MGITSAETTSGTFASQWSPARVYLAVTAAYLLVLGVAGFLSDASFPTSSAAVGHHHVLGIFDTNGWHNLAGMVFGALALVAALDPTRARMGALIVAVPNAFVFVTFALVDPSTFWFASNGADNVVHAVLGFGGIAAALATPARRSRAARAIPS